jgi:hypothetical protein
MGSLTNYKASGLKRTESFMDRTISGNYSNADDISSEKIIKLTKQIHLFKNNLPFTPQRLIVTAPLDVYGRPQVQFTEFSKLITPLPDNCYCYLENLYINNFIGGMANNSFYAPLSGTITAQTLTNTSTFTLTITNNPNNITIRLYDIFTFTVAEGYVYEAYCSTASATAPVFTILNPNATYTGGQIPQHGGAVNWNAGFNQAVAAQTINGTYMYYTATGQGMLGVSSVNIELVDFISSSVYDTQNNTYSKIVCSAPCPNVYNRQDLPTEVNFKGDPSINSTAFPITDPNALNNRNINFRLTINDGSSLLPQPAPQYGPMPYNIAPNFTPSSGNVIVPWGATCNSTTTYTAPSTQYFVPVFSYVPIIRFTLVFLQLQNTSDGFSK